MYWTRHLHSDGIRRPAVGRGVASIARFSDYYLVFCGNALTSGFDVRHGLVMLFTANLPAESPMVVRQIFGGIVTRID